MPRLSSASNRLKYAAVAWLCCRGLAAAEPPDLAPLLPPSGGGGVADALRSGDVKRAAVFAAALPSEDARRLWRGTLAIVGNDAVTAIRTLRPLGDSKALGVAYYLARQYVLFREQMHAAIRREPSDFGPYYLLGRHYDSELDDCAEAVRWFRLALERNPAYGRAHAHLGYCLERQGDAAGAERAYQSSIGLALSQAGMARLQQKAGRAAEALTWAQKAEGDPAADRLAARLYESLGRPAEAIAALERLRRAVPHDASVLYQLHRLHRAAKDDARAKAALAEYERVRAIYGAQPER
ncbi:MAG: hypothetical protein FJW31_27015 [Acidobacteria bacterium]|nr:hypothetical protein [Acidobacteriota bacterium]